MNYNTRSFNHPPKTTVSQVLTNDILLNSFTDPVIIYDLNQCVYKVNNAFLRTYGVNPGGWNFKDFCALFDEVPLENSGLDSKATSKALTGERIEGVKFSFQKGGTQFNVEACSAPLMVDIEIIGALTTWRTLENQNFDSEIKIDKRITDLLPLSVLTCRNGFIEYVNTAGLTLFGATHNKELTGKTIEEVISPDFHTSILPSISELDIKEVEMKIVRMDGVVKDVEIISINIPSKTSNIIQVYLKDITSKKKTEYFNNTLNLIENVIHSSVNTFEISEKAMQMAGEIITCDSAAVSVLKNDHWEVLHLYNFPEIKPGFTVPLHDENHALLALAEKRSQLIEDAYNDPRVNNERMKRWGIQSVIVMPLFTSRGNIGVIFFNFYKKRKFSPEKSIFLTRLSTSLSLALENSELFEQLNNELQTRKINEHKLIRLNNTLLALSRSSNAMVHAKNEKEYSREICNIITSVCNQALAWVGFHTENKIVPMVWAGESKGYIETLSIDISPEKPQGPTSLAFNQKTHSICNDIEKASEFLPWRENAIKFGIASCISLPLIYIDDVYGVLNIYSREKNAFSDDEISLLCELSRYLSQGIAAIRLNNAKIDAEKNLKESEERFRMIAESSNALICELDSNTKIIYANACFRDIFGTVVLNNETIISLFPEDKREVLINHIYNHSDVTAPHEWKLKDKDGVWRWFRSYSGVFDTSHYGKRWSLMLFDICDIKLAEVNLKKLAEELKILNNTKDKFFSIIAHDLKNPFTGLMGGSELLLSSIDDKETTLKLGVMIHESARRGYLLLQNLLEWSRSQTGTISFEPERVNLFNLVKDSIENLKASYETKNQKVAIYIPEHLAVKADINMLSTVIRNLVQNAIKFSFNNSTTTVSAANTDKEIIISIQDEGTGISPNYIDRLFRIDEKLSMPGTNKETGTGLGLLLCKEFIEKHSGRIWVESQEGKGSTFFISLPEIN